MAGPLGGLALMLVSSGLAWAQAAPPPPGDKAAKVAVDADKSAADKSAADKDAADKDARTVAPRATAITARMTLKVVHPDQVRAELIARVKDKKGFPILITDRALHLKVPPQHVPDLLRFASKKGTVLAKSMTRKDRTQIIAQLEGRVRSKTGILRRLRGFIDDSNVSATLQIERSMTRLVNELEKVRGQLRVERERARFATLAISFNYQRRGRISYVHSPFSWLNTVDINRFLREF